MIKFLPEEVVKVRFGGIKSMCKRKVVRRVYTEDVDGIEIYRYLNNTMSLNH